MVSEVVMNGHESSEKPDRCTEAQLKKVGVSLVAFANVRLRCHRCGQCWSPNLRPGGGLPKGYWKCPNGCNVK